MQDCLLLFLLCPYIYFCCLCSYCVSSQFFRVLFCILFSWILVVLILMYFLFVYLHYSGVLCVWLYLVLFAFLCGLCCIILHMRVFFVYFVFRCILILACWFLLYFRTFWILFNFCCTICASGVFFGTRCSICSYNTSSILL